MSEARKAAVFSCEYSEQNPVYEYEERQNQKDDLGKSIVRNLTAYLKGKGVGDKGE